MSSHGPQNDEYHAQATHGHNGAEYDEFGGPKAGTGALTGLADHFPQRKGVDRYGEHWDEFGWTPMPAKHGQNFDENFGQPTALDGGEHGTWHDVFRGGTQVRYIFDGIDCEGTVLNTGNDHVAVTSRDGQRHEIGLGQIQGWRQATDQATRGGGDTTPTATPGNTPAPKREQPHTPSSHGKVSGNVPRQDLAAAEKTDADAGVDVAKTISDLRGLVGLAG